ncbi:ArsR family transcriptional regulator [Natronolimnohabitans sp. A-GB9]|uniref:DUF7344 domain-containing protein n=1 Tax=Natronolimnohabitans sp. A-GB9 TaxID=3069757 RepID=UPI0027B7EADC|nr:ArsR family transcriptional regulator [Natronolimnohabitans sp. A-GB9]MDQ2051954.1 ArsR family transcriptional regulator [Natronolimnohabitans sp. A-GB9]
MLPVISDPESLSTPSGHVPSATDSQFDVLADRRRRSVLGYLDATEGPVSLSDLADHLVLEDHAEADGALASCGDALFGTRRRVQLSLRHSHVPKLADAGAVDFDHDTNTVTLCDRGAKLLARAESIDADDSHQDEHMTETPTP